MAYAAGDHNLDGDGSADHRETRRVGSTEEVAPLAQFTGGVKHRPTKRYYLSWDSRPGALRRRRTPWRLPREFVTATRRPRGVNGQRPEKGRGARHNLY